MSDALFSLDIESRSSLVRASLHGLFEASDVQRYFDAQRELVTKSGCIYGRHRILLDIRDWPVQPQDVVIEFQRQLRAGMVAQRAAILCSSSLLRLQLNRLLEQRQDARVFENSGHAEAWLLADE